MGRWATWVSMALVASGCGLVLDLDPPDVDAGGMDAGLIDAGPPPECREDDDCGPRDSCGDHLVCRRGDCVPNTDIRTCDDFIPCTIDRCTDDGDCEHVPGPCVGAPPDTGCSGYRCDLELGCELTEVVPCDDDIACTEDVCLVDSGGCDAEPRHERCPGSSCTAVAEGSGCAPVECDSATDCPDDPCVTAWVCDSVNGTCAVSETAPDGAPCPNAETCAATSVCRGGVCQLDTRVDCDDNNPCTRDFCDVEGNCQREDRDGFTCRSGPCSRGMCNGGLCGAGVNTCLAVDASCEKAVCSGLASCERSYPCVEENRECDGSGNCGDCLHGFEDCDEDDVCERNVAAQGPCPSDDAGVPPVDAGVLDAGHACGPGGVPVSAEDVCPPGTTDCDGDGCCECGLDEVCSLVHPFGACVPRECTASDGCGMPTLPQCCCGQCVPLGFTCPAVCVAPAV